MDSDPQRTPGPPAGVPTCYRHPDKETYIRCVRCDRPICPNCMREASVGQQCVECVKEGNRDVRQARTAFGGRVAQRAILTWVILGINVLVYLGELANTEIINRLAMAPYLVADGDWYRLLTATVLHAPPTPLPLHILFNMVALAILGPPLEMVLGRLRFGSLYLLSALGGSVAGLLFAHPCQGSLGASGAIFGLFGATFVVSRRMRVPTGGIMVILALNLVISFTLPGIDWRAHLGGLIIGSALAAAYAYAPVRSRTLIQGGVTAGLTVLLIVAVLARVPQLAGVACLS